MLGLLTIALVFPATMLLPAFLRERVRDAIYGKAEHHGYTSTTAPNEKPY